MKVIYVCTLLVTMMSIGACTSAESTFNANCDFSKVDKIALVDVAGNVSGEIPKNVIADLFAMELL